MFHASSCTLIPFSTDRAPEFFALIDKNRAFLRTWLPWLDHTLNENDSRNFLANSIQEEQQGIVLLRFIVLNQQIIGTIGLRDITAESALVGYWIAEEYQGLGVITHSLMTLIRLANENAITQKIILRCEPRNIASNKVAQKCGFVFSHTEPNAEKLYGKSVDLNIYEYRFQTTKTV